LQQAWAAYLGQTVDESVVDIRLEITRHNLLASPPRPMYHRRSMTDLTQLLRALAKCDPHAASRLLRLVSHERCQLAAKRMAHEQFGPKAPAVHHLAHMKRSDERC
jgi:hypothetical protein